MRKIAFIHESDAALPDFNKFIRPLQPAGSQFTFLRYDVDNVNLDKDTVIVFVVDRTGARLDPDRVTERMFDAEIHLKRQIDGIVVLSGTSNGMGMALTSLDNIRDAAQYGTGIAEGFRKDYPLRTTYAVVGMNGIKTDDKPRLITLLKQWYEDVYEWRSKVKPSPAVVASSQAATSAPLATSAMQPFDKEDYVGVIFKKIQQTLEAAAAAQPPAKPYPLGYAGSRYKIGNVSVPKPIKEIYDICQSEKYTPKGKLEKIQASIEREVHIKWAKVWRELWLFIRRIFGRALQKETESALLNIRDTVMASSR